MNFKNLKDQPRLLVEADLMPLQGTRFQPTGFPDLGPATYQLPGESKTSMLLLESTQSVANRLESTIWDEATQALVEPLQGISYVEIKRSDELLTNSLLEAHRLNSSYILKNNKDKKSPFFEKLKQELDVLAEGPVNFHKLAQVLAKYDINSLLHGVFLADKELAGGRFKLARALSGFIEARNVSVVSSGGVKNDRVDPTGKAQSGGGAKEGRGNIPYHRDEYAAEAIKAYFNLDLTQIRSYWLGAAVEDLLIAIAIWKIQRFLEWNLRLRTACDLEYTEIRVKRPDGFKLPDHKELTAALPTLVKAAAPAFADPPVTIVQYQAEETGNKK